MNKKRTFLLIVFSLVFIGASIFFLKKNTSNTQTDVLSENQSSPDLATIFQENKTFLDIFSSITNIVIDTSIFQNPVFTILRDNTVFIEKGPIGRSNPFLPIFTPRVASTQSNSSQIPVIDDSSLSVGEKVAIEVVTKVIDFIEENKITIPILNLNNNNGGGGNKDIPPKPPIIKRPELFSIEVKGVIDDTEAKRVIGVVKDRCGIDLSQYIDIQKDLTLPFPSYKIQGSQVAYNGDRFNNTALYAVSRISEDLFNAKMIWPSDDGIFCNSKPSGEQVKNILGAYKKEWKPDYYIMDFFNVPGSKNEQMWFSWHHLPTDGSNKLYWLSDTFKGLAKEHPELAPKVYKNQPITEETKPNVLHPDFPRFVYEKWVAGNGGTKDLVNLFELDGTRFDQYVDEFPMPEGLTKQEQDFFKYTILQSRIVDNALKYIKVSDGFVENLKKWLPFYNDRVVLTPIYIRGYKSIEKYFQDQGVNNVRFMIYAYSAYYYMPPDLNVDLSNFDVYYTSPGSAAWNRAAMEADLENWKRWERTGATMIWRPNLWFANPFDPHLNFNLHNEFVYRAKPDGYYITGYTPGSVDGVQGINRYTMFRVLQGRTPQQAFDDYVSTFDPVNQPLIRQYVTLAEETVTNKQQFTNERLSQMMAILDRGNNDAMMQQFKKGVEIARKKNDYFAKNITRTEFVDWFKGEVEKFPGLGNWGRFNISSNKVEVPEY